MAENTILYIISDSSGETAQSMAQAGICQFPNHKDWEVKRIPYVNHLEALKEALEEAKAQKAMVMFSLVDEKLADFAGQYCQNEKLCFVDLMSDMLKQMSRQAEEVPLREAGKIRQLTKSYFNRIEAIEFAVKYDDGKDPRGFLKADLVLLGVSRTSKTPLSIYLANKQLKVANLPLIPEVPLPKEIFEVDPKKIVGLTSSPERLNKMRSQRLKAMGLDSTAHYAQKNRILEELDYFYKIMKALKCPVIDIEHRSIEETAGLIMDRLSEVDTK
ncbi:pyruvate, water dikinase regulatory protein [Streptococcus orisasini]